MTLKIESICVRCREPLFKEHFNQRYCKPCAKIRNREKTKEWNDKREKRENWQEIRCKICNVRFMARRGSRKYCSYQCRKDSMKLNRLYKTITSCQRIIKGILK